MQLLNRFLGGLIRTGRLTLITHDDTEHVYGGGPGPRVTARLHDPSLLRRLFQRPELVSGEAYMEGTLTVEEGTLREFFDLITGNMGWQPDNPLNAKNARVRRVRNWFAQRDSSAKARRSVAHHYDLSNELFRRFLDGEMHYFLCLFHGGQP